MSEIILGLNQRPTECCLKIQNLRLEIWCDCLSPDPSFVEMGFVRSGRKNECFCHNLVGIPSGRKIIFKNGEFCCVARLVL
jgi:hypothetical protein